MSGVINKFRKHNFYLSPMEFLAMAWVYRNEIVPFLKSPDIKQGEKINVAATIKSLRSAILNKELKDTECSDSEWAYISSVIPELFQLFSLADKIRKPELELICDARGKLADLIYTDSLGNIVQVDSAMKNGKIEFHILESSIN